MIISVGCVGTIKNQAETINSGVKVPPVKIYFDGIKSAEAVSHRKVRLTFKPATGGSGSFDYRAFVNGSLLASASLSAAQAIPDGMGDLHLVVDGLNQSTLYSFNVQAVDREYGETDGNIIDLKTSTLNYLVPLFEGINSLENVPGLDGETKLLAKWNAAVEAAPNTNPFGSNPYAIGGYKIFVGQSEESLVQVATIPDPEATSFLIDNLESGINYLVRVRAFDSQNPPIEELNKVTIEKKTLTTQPILFAGISKLSVPTNSSGYSTLTLEWVPGTGSFDRYLIFVSNTPKTSFNPAEDIPVQTITSLSAKTINVTVSQSHTTYYAAVVACNGQTCTASSGANKVLSTKTTPPVALFNGITSINQTDGLLGLSSLEISWNSPDTTQGVFNEFRLFKTNTAGVFDELVDRIPTYNPMNPNVPSVDITYGSLTATSTVKARIRGLTTGQEYCFVLKAYATNPADPSAPNGRTHNNQKKVCATPTFLSPGFSGINASCTNITSTSLKISWTDPDPVGIFDYYKVWYRTAQGGSFNFSSAISGDPTYELLIAPKNTTSMTITGLSPNTNYRIGMKTFINIPPDTYDNNVSIANCSTSSATVKFEGWNDVMSIGPKIDGINRTVIKEKITEALSATPLDDLYSHPIPQEYPAGEEGVNASTQGIVRLEWSDFSISGVGSMSDFTSNASTGYNIYRMNWTVSHESLPPALNASGWGQPLNTELIKPKEGSKGTFVEFIDYTVSRQGLDTNETRIYWYKVEAVMNGTVMNYSSLQGDEVIKVILPPNNMALIHRWIANKEICDSMNRPIDRTQNYRCQFNGLASKNGFYDSEKHFIIDRWFRGCNFSRGFEDRKCTGGDANFEGTGSRSGDCVRNGAGATAVQMQGSPGAVGLIRGNSAGNFCLYNASTTATANWMTAGNFESNTNDFSTTIPKSSPQFPSGQGIGQRFVSNNAKLPQFSAFTPRNGHRICAAFDIKHKNTNIIMRPPRQKEMFVAAAWSPHMSSPEQISDGTRQTGIPDRDCYVGTPKNNGLLSLDYNYNNYPSAVAISSYGMVMVSGSSSNTNNPYSTEACVSRFGLQDPVQIRIGTFTSNTLWCVPGQGCSASRKDVTVSSTETPNENMKFTPTYDPASKETLKTSVDSPHAYLIAKPSDTFLTLTTPSTLVRHDQIGGYTSMSLGFPLKCDSEICADDDKLATRRTSDLFADIFLTIKEMPNTTGNRYDISNSVSGEAPLIFGSNFKLGGGYSYSTPDSFNRYNSHISAGSSGSPNVQAMDATSYAHLRCGVELD